MNDAEPAAGALSQLFLGRQPILDARQTLIGYELLFRNSNVNRAAEIAPGMATADVVCKAFAELGLGRALDGYKAFVIVDAAFLQHEAIEALPPDGAVFELDVALATRPAVAERCLELSGRGYSFCLIHQAEDPAQDALDPLTDYATFLKLNVAALPAQRLESLLAQAHARHLVAIASHVETRAQHENALALGFQLFQGYYFAEPKLIEGRKIDASLQNLLRIVHLINQDAELPAIEQAFKADAALTLKLLRLTNSVGVGLRTRIGSVRQAINIIGRRPMLRWLQLLLFSQGGAEGIERNPLMQLAALKGNFMEGLARRCHPTQAGLPDMAFLAGLMSLMPNALGLPMEEILDQLAVAPPLRMALVAREGELGQLLELTDCYDNDDPAGADRVLAQMGNRIDRATLNQCLAEAIAWVQALSVEKE